MSADQPLTRWAGANNGYHVVHRWLLVLKGSKCFTQGLHSSIKARRSRAWLYRTTNATPRSGSCVVPCCQSKALLFP